MKWYHYLLIPVLVLFFSSCVKNEFTVEFSFPKDVWGNYYVYYYASSKTKGLWLEATAPLHDGKFSLKGVTRYPTMIYIARQQGVPPEVVLYAEHGDRLVLSGKNDDPLEWNLEKGNDISKQLTTWRLENVSALRSRNNDSINAAVKREVLANPDKKTSTIILLTYFDRNLDMSAFAYLWNALSPKAKPDEIVDLCAPLDLSGDLVYSRLSDGRLRRTGGGASLKSIVLPSPEGKRRALKTSTTPASLFLFDRNSNPSHSTDTDTLRSLVKAFPDSASRLIVKVSLEPDSLSWTYPLMSDSLKKVEHGWIPLGEADSRLRTLGVARSPWWIVTDSTGSMKYSGCDSKKAASTFRKLLKNRLQK